MELNEIKGLFNKGFNCSQIVFSELGPSLGIPREECLRIASGFGAGMAYMQETCGAVTGALMVIGAKYGPTSDHEQEKKTQTYETIRKFISLFKEKHSSIKCSDLLGSDITTPEGLQKTREMKLFELKCPVIVKDSIDVLNNLIKS
jgi:C_GCAxxG_C_C family probable redox protein